MDEPAGFDSVVAAVLAYLKTPEARLIGKGNEGRVYEYGDERVLKIYMLASTSDLDRLAEFQSWLAKQGLPFRTPEIQRVGIVAGTAYTIERRLPGERLDQRFAVLSQDAQRRALTNYFAAVEAIGRVEMDDEPFYGHVLPSIHGIATIRESTWTGFLLGQIEQRLEKAHADLALDVEQLNDKIHEMRRLVLTLPKRAPMRLVHGDYFLGNVLFDSDLQVSAVLDFGAHTLAGDPRVDIAGAIAFLGPDDVIGLWHTTHIDTLAEARYGHGIHALIDLYLLYYSLYFGDTKVSDPPMYGWCVNNLNDASRWRSARQ